jgi:hypothetical protein
MMADKALLPNPQFDAPVVFESSAPDPKALFAVPVVLALSALKPKADTSEALLELRLPYP